MQNGTATTLSPLLDTGPTLNQALGYGFLAVTVTNMAALGGLLFAPLSKCSGYMTFMSFMVTTAVGSLFSSALLVLVPEALNLSSFESYVPNGHKKWYLPITIAICGGSFLFFTIEFILRRIRAFLESRSSKRDSLGTTNSMAVTNGCCIPVLAGKRNYSDFPYRLREPVAHGDQVAENPRVNPRLSDHDSHKPAALLTNEVDKNHHQQSEKSGCCASRSSHCSRNRNSEPLPSQVNPITFSTPHLCAKLGSLEPVVWMIVIGDGVHNFMDGLSLGAGFRQSLSLGLSLTLSVLCEELPHELGDVAILLRSGLSIPLALLFNFGSACTAYIGLLVGVFVGELTSASAFIFALTAGFFLYIALVDMLPEVRSMEETVAHDSRQAIIRFFVHCSGMIFGFSCILTVVLTSDYINF